MAKLDEPGLPAGVPLRGCNIKLRHDHLRCAVGVLLVGELERDCIKQVYEERVADRPASDKSSNKPVISPWASLFRPSRYTLVTASAMLSDPGGVGCALGFRAASANVVIAAALPPAPDGPVGRAAIVDDRHELLTMGQHSTILRVAL